MLITSATHLKQKIQQTIFRGCILLWYGLSLRTSVANSMGKPIAMSGLSLCFVHTCSNFLRLLMFLAFLATCCLVSPYGLSAVRCMYLHCMDYQQNCSSDSCHTPTSGNYTWEGPWLNGTIPSISSGRPLPETLESSCWSE